MIIRPHIRLTASRNCCDCLPQIMIPAVSAEQKAQIEVIKATSLTQLSSAERALEEALETAEHNAKITIMTLKLEKLDD